VSARFEVLIPDADGTEGESGEEAALGAGAQARRERRAGPDRTTRPCTGVSRLTYPCP